MIDIALAKPADRTLITVDNFSWNPCYLTSQEHKDVTRAILKHAVATANVILCECDKNEFYATYIYGPPAMVFLDATHTHDETSRDIVWALKVGAHVIIGYDYSPEFPGIIKAVERFGGCGELVGTLWRLRF